MEVLLKSAKIIDPTSPHHNHVHDIRIVDGEIREIGENLNSEGKIIESEHLHVSQGWFDMRVNFCDPGHEYKETLESGTATAAAGGFTGVLVMPGTVPPVHTKIGVDYLVRKGSGMAVDVVPAGTLSHEGKGEQLAEMYDMHTAGAKAFTDDKKPVNDAGLMSRALMYTRNFDGLTISFPYDPKMAPDGQMHEGATSTQLGLRGIPGEAESIRINRDLELLAYTESRMHIATVSTKRGVELIRKAKADGLKVTAEVAAHNLYLTDEALVEYDSHLKTLPPLRSQTEIDALIEGLNDGTLDAICSDHTPEVLENKQLEFGLAAFGMAGLQTAFSNALEGTKAQLPLEKLIEKFTTGPRHILRLESPAIAEGNTANITVFDPEKTWTVEASDWKSKSKNTPYFGKTLTGKVLGIINNGQAIF